MVSRPLHAYYLLKGYIVGMSCPYISIYGGRVLLRVQLLAGRIGGCRPISRLGPGSVRIWSGSLGCGLLSLSYNPLSLPSARFPYNSLGPGIVRPRV